MSYRPTRSRPRCSLPPGLVLTFGLRAGLYIMVVAVLAAFLGGVASAWLFMTRVGDASQ